MEDRPDLKKRWLGEKMLLNLYADGHSYDCCNVYFRNDRTDFYETLQFLSVLSLYVSMLQK